MRRNFYQKDNNIKMFSSFFNIQQDFRIAAYLKDGSYQNCYSRILLIEFRKATHLKTGLSQMYFWRILLIDFKTLKMVYLKLHYNEKVLKRFCSNNSCLLSSGSSYISMLVYFPFLVAQLMSIQSGVAVLPTGPNGSKKCLML